MGRVTSWSACPLIRPSSPIASRTSFHATDRPRIGTLSRARALLVLRPGSLLDIEKKRATSSKLALSSSMDHLRTEEGAERRETENSGEIFFSRKRPGQLQTGRWKSCNQKIHVPINLKRVRLPAWTKEAKTTITVKLRPYAVNLRPYAVNFRLFAAFYRPNTAFCRPAARKLFNLLRKFPPES